MPAAATENLITCGTLAAVLWLRSEAREMLRLVVTLWFAFG